MTVYCLGSPVVIQLATVKQCGQSVSEAVWLDGLLQSQRCKYDKYDKQYISTVYEIMLLKQIIIIFIMNQSFSYTFDQ